MPEVWISDEQAQESLDLLDALKRLDVPMDKAQNRAMRAAEILLRMYETQRRYNLKPQTPDDFHRATRYPRSNAQELEHMTPDEVLELQRTIVAAEWNDD
jgi:hypothetical protein